MPFFTLTGVPLPFFAALPAGVLEVVEFEGAPSNLAFGVAVGFGAIRRR